MKNIVVCCDGTGNEYGRNNTNVVETYALSRKTDTQVTYYDAGVGTGGWQYEEETGHITAINDQATGHGLQKNVVDAYRYLMATYEPDDRVYLFGFSRGAFTVRSLAGMLGKVGLLDTTADNLVEYASKLYSKYNEEYNADIAAGFKATFSRPCRVYFIGVWDTVASLVMNAGKRFHDVTVNPDVAFHYQAVSIDERRKDFPPCLWDETAIRADQTVEQVWFAGVHSDVGGWYDQRGLSNIALHWMLGKARACGMQIDDKALAERVPDPHAELHNSRKGIWRIRGRHKRQIPEHASIHASVEERLRRASNGYHPDNLPAHPSYVM